MILSDKNKLGDSIGKLTATLAKNEIVGKVFLIYVKKRSQEKMNQPNIDRNRTCLNRILWLPNSLDLFLWRNNLMKQKQMSKKGIDYLNTELWVSWKRKTKKTNITLTFFLLVHVWLETSWGDISVLNTKNRPKQKELCAKKYKNNHSATKYCRFAKHSHQHSPIIVAGHTVTTSVATSRKWRNVKINGKPKE